MLILNGGGFTKQVHGHVCGNVVISEPGFLLLPELEPQLGSYRAREPTLLNLLIRLPLVFFICFFFFSCSLIYHYYSGKDPNSKDNSVGLQLLGIVLANDLPPYDPACGIEHDRYTLMSAAIGWHLF